jgi:DNA gyrase subunit A
VNILPIEPGTGIAAVMPVDRDEDHWDELQIVFATDRGTVRRNALSDFTNVMRNGKIAMKFEGESEGWRLINARIASNEDDVMLVTQVGRAIRFPTTDVRVFKGRDSTGVRGIKLAEGMRSCRCRSSATSRRGRGTRRLSQAAPPDGRRDRGAETDEDEAAEGD